MYFELFGLLRFNSHQRGKKHIRGPRVESLFICTELARMFL